MSGIAEYLLGIVAVCLISSVAKQLLGISKSYKALGNTIIGIFIVLSIISPVVSDNWSYGDALDTGFEEEMELISQDAERYRQDVMCKSIISQTETYILSKARELSVDIDVEITLSDSYPYAPIRICIWGKASPYAKTQLSAYIKDEIGIAKEAQMWMEAKS